MSYCINPDCSQPQNKPTDEICRNCGSKLLLKERYRAIKVLGQGGFGRTYLAIDQDRLNASCVIKQFLPQVQGTGALEKATELFYQEAIRLNDLGVHPQIPDLLAFFTQDKRQYLVQEFVPGMNLQKLLERYGKFTEAEIWAILRDILPILEFVHERQVIHRDIKPENIIRRQGDNKLFLIDFGVAKLLTDPQRVITGTSIGTSGYVPIEQMSEGKAYPASDIYSLGVTCFHLLTGVSPYSLFIKRGYSWLQTWQDYVPPEVSPRLNDTGKTGRPLYYGNGSPAGGRASGGKEHWHSHRNKGRQRICGDNSAGNHHNGTETETRGRGGGRQCGRLSARGNH